MLILYMAWQMAGDAGRKKVMNYTEFRKQYDAGNIFVKGQFEGASKEDLLKLKIDPKADVPRFVTNESSAAGTIYGKINVGGLLDRDADKSKLEKAPRYLIIDKVLQGDEFNVIIQDIDVRNELLDSKNDIEAIIKPAVDDEGVAAAGPKKLTLEGFRKLVALDELTNIQLFAVSGGDQILVTADQVEFPAKKPEEKAGKTVSPQKYDFVPFEVKVNLLQYSDAERAFIKQFRHDPKSGGFGSIMIQLLPIFLIVLVIIFLFRHQMKSAGKGAMNFGKSRARLLSMDRDRVTFKDVAGIQEAKEELFEIVDFLKDPKKFQMLGGSIPKGVLMVGPPGTGKTLLARAIAGEAEVPFFSISGSDFVEMFVGVGASRVRDMFEQGKKNSPCIVFIDEIDAVGRHRGHGHGGGHDEREQTLNALLVEMDGFDAHSGVIIIAATNRPDVLDPALLRPGRFDRQVTVALPDVKGREQILKVHAKKIKLKEGTTLSTVAKGTPGFSGAELANLINEAALLAARKGLKEVTLAELEEARDKVRWGRERRSLALSDKEKENTAYHEAGHAICNLVCENTDSLHKVTIIPRGPALGMAMFLPEEDRVNYREAELIDQLCVAMGGRVAEELVFGNVTNGAMGDIRQATQIARKMVCEWGMSKHLGMVDYGGDEHQEMFMAANKTYSEETARKIDLEIKELIDGGYERAQQILNEHRDSLDVITKALLEYETLSGEQIKELLETGEMSDPPSMPTPPEPPIAPQPDEKKKAPEVKDSKDDDPLAGEAIGVTA